MVARNKKFSILACMAFTAWFWTNCDPEPAGLQPAVLEVRTPFDLGVSPHGISTRKYFKFKNAGSERLTITDYKLKPNNGVFVFQMPEMPLTLGSEKSVELPVTFRPTDEGPFEADLDITYNHSGDKPDAIPLKGTGESNLVCLPCEPPPSPFCSLEGEVSVRYEPTSPTDCESEEDVCSYLMQEDPCGHSDCDDSSGRCETPPTTDSGVEPPTPALQDAGAPTGPSDSGTFSSPGDSGVGSETNDAGANTPHRDAGTPDPCEDVLCPENSSCLDGACLCAEGFEVFDAGSQCTEICVPSECDDNDRCTLDFCDDPNGCVHTAVACNNPSDAQCQAAVGSCNPSTGECEYEAVAGLCDDGDLCTLDDTCQNGACVSGGAVTCNTPADPQCQQVPGTCDPANGGCNYQAKAGPCDDGDLCTLNDQCNNGSCNSGANKICNTPPNNQCYAPNGTCDSANGNCSYTKVNGGCDDGDPCTVNDQCNDGVCQGTLMVCNDSGTVCKSNDGTCVGGFCQYPNLDGVDCDDGDACTQVDACQGGVCVGSDNIVCNDHEGDPCFGEGQCQKNSGLCDYPVNVGANCDGDDLCSLNKICLDDGSCGGGSPVTCSGVPPPENPCKEVRSTCDPIEGCYQNKPAEEGSCCDGLGNVTGGPGNFTICSGCEGGDCCCSSDGECIKYFNSDGTVNSELCGEYGF